MWTEDQYASASQAAEGLCHDGRQQEAREVLWKALKEARAAGDEGPMALMEGEIAFLDRDYERAVELLALARRKTKFSSPLRFAIDLRWHDAFDCWRTALTERRAQMAAWRSLSARSAHRIGNQLFAAQGALRTLRKVEDAEAAEAVSDLEATLDRMRRIVQEFRTFSRSQEPRLLPTDVGTLVGNIARRYAKLAEEIGVTARVRAGLPRCSADRAQLDQAMGELLENALRHTPEGGSIDVTAEPVEGPSGQRVRIVVADTGPGIPEADKDAVFRPFVSRRPGGSGLGLAIVKQIVENHGGTIREAGKAGEGARFEIELPALPDEEASDEGTGD